MNTNKDTHFVRVDDGEKVSVIEQRIGGTERLDTASTRAETDIALNKDTKKDESNNPRLGIPFVLLGTLFFCASRTFAKYIFVSYPLMSTFQFMYLRAGVSLLFNVILINKNLKNVLWDSIGKEQRCGLLARVIMNIISTFVAFTSVKYFPLTYSASVRNISPFFALLLSCLCL